MFKVDIQVPIPHTCMLKSFKQIILSELMKPIDGGASYATSLATSS